MVANTSIKVVCLFSFLFHVEISQTATPLGTIWKELSMNMGALSCFHNVLTYNGEVIEY
jgi:hypothetical protein